MPAVKSELEDLDLYEEAGDMMSIAEQRDLWLARVPDWLFDSIMKYDAPDSEQIQIGEVLAFATTSGIDKTKPMRMFLDDRWQATANKPTAFQLDPAATSETVLANTYIFTEKEVPDKYKGLSRDHPGKDVVLNSNARVQKRGKYKKAIPKQTALLGHASRQYNAHPLETKEFKDFSAQRIKQAIQGSHLTTVITKDTEVTDVKNQNTLNDRFKNFIRPTSKPKTQQNKAARVSRADLIDMLHSCFDEFQYWPMKALKIRTKQPEQFLKEVLTDIAHLVKSGSFASTWQRQAIFDKERDTTSRQDQADVGDVESDGEEMEDVF